MPARATASSPRAASRILPAAIRAGVCVAMCDGSVHFVRDTIDGTVWCRLMTPAGSLLRIGPNGEGGDFRQGPLTQADLEP